MRPMSDRLAFSVHGGFDAAPAAREAVRGADGAIPSALREDVLLLVTELVTNAVLHAGVGPDQFLQVELTHWPRRLRVEVTQPGDGFRCDRVDPSPGTSGGWGLVLVDRIADGWGIISSTGGTGVWFDLRSGA
jgi:anti-sigma regulatory factor (Ser/Thr protein kinase)